MADHASAPGTTSPTSVAKHKTEARFEVGDTVTITQSSEDADWSGLGNRMIKNEKMTVGSSKVVAKVALSWKFFTATDDTSLWIPVSAVTKAHAKHNSDDARPGSRTKKKSNEVRRRLLDDFHVGEILGQGAFGIVYACKRKTPSGLNGDYAVKMVDKVESTLQDIEKEAEMLRRLNQGGIIKCHDVIYERCFVCIVMDRLHGGDLIVGMQKHWESKGRIRSRTIIHVTAQMAASISYLHTHRVVHRDIKGDNFLIDQPDISPSVKVVLTDFGTAAACTPEDRLHEECGTPHYWAPEFCKLNYSLKVDVWAIGILVFGLVCAKFPFRDEQEILTMPLPIPSNASKECRAFLHGVLGKNEDKRFDHSAMVAHPFIVYEVKECDADEMGTPKAQHASSLQHFLPEESAHGGVKDRREELIARLHDAQAIQQGISQSKGEQYWKDWFTVEDRYHPGVVTRYDWWTSASANRLLLEGPQVVAQNGSGSTASIEVVENQLKSHGIRCDMFGIGGAKSLHQFVKELQHGSAVLMLDAAEHKKLVRVVDVVILRICAPGSKTSFLVETCEEFADGRCRNLIRLPAALKKAHMNTKQTAERILNEVLDLDVRKVSLNFNKKEIYEEQEESPSYPGVQTVYRKEIVEGMLQGDPDGGYIGKHAQPNTWFHQDLNGNVKYFKWMSEHECGKEDVECRAPEEAAKESCLVHAPIGLDEQGLKDFFQHNKIDLSKYGKGSAKSLKEFSAELTTGESSLNFHSEGVVERVVDVVLLKLIHSVTKKVLVQSQRTFPDGLRKSLGRLPGLKRRADENYFRTARRIIQRELRIDENHVTIDTTTVHESSERLESVNYPGLITLYRKTIITAVLSQDGEAPQPSAPLYDRLRTWSRDGFGYALSLSFIGLVAFAIGLKVKRTCAIRAKFF